MNRSLRIKRQVGRLVDLSSGGPGAGPRKIVLIYHAVGEGAGALATNAFEAQMRWLAEHARVLPLASLLRDDRSISGRLACSLTFDDGYASVHGQARPILRELGFPATVYLTTAAIDETVNRSSADFPGLHPGHRMLTWTQVDDLVEAGMTIGSHLMRHLDLTRVDEKQARDELIGSRTAIERRLRLPCVDFSYPWGRHNPTVRRWVREAGFNTAAAGIHRAISRDTDPLAFPRMDVRSEYELADFEALARGAWDFLGSWQLLKSAVSQ